MKPRRRTISPRGFTLFELMIGMMVTALVAAASAALLSAVAAGWCASEAAGNGSNRVTMTHVRLQRVLRAAKQLGAVRPGAIEGGSTAAVLIWKGDANLDNKVQFSELGLLEFEPDDGKLWYYEVNYPLNWNSAQIAAADGDPLPSDDIYRDDEGDSAITDFKDADYVEPTVLAEGIGGVEFRVYDSASTTRPRMEYLINFMTGTNLETEYGAVTLRTPATLPSSQSGG